MNVVLDGWVVYQAMTGKYPGALALCRQREWEAMKLAHPGKFAFIRGGIPGEAEAERLARGTSGEVKEEVGAQGFRDAVIGRPRYFHEKVAFLLELQRFRVLDES